MKRRVPIGCTVLLAFLDVLVLGAPAWAAKVQVCHVPPGNPSNFHIISINDNALQAHLAHGDLAGPCSAHCSQLCDDGNACTIDACDASERCLIEHPPVNCDDSNLCTDDTCNPESGCASTPKTCQDDFLCTVDACDPLTGSCVFPPVACPAGQACNTGTGSCENEVVTCPCSSISQFNAILENLNYCLDLGGALIVSIDPPVRTEPVIFRDSAGGTAPGSGDQCGVLRFGLPLTVLNITPEEAGACIQLVRAAIARRGVTC
jgi:hypothetical protein